MRPWRIEIARPFQTTSIGLYTPAARYGGNIAWNTSRRLVSARFMHPCLQTGGAKLTHRVEIPTTPQTILDPQSLLIAQKLTPRLIELQVELPMSALVACIPY